MNNPGLYVYSQCLIKPLHDVSRVQLKSEYFFYPEGTQFMDMKVNMKVILKVLKGDGVGHPVDT